MPRTCRPYRDTDLEPLVALWNRTKRDAYPYLPREQSRTVDEDRSFFTTSILARCAVHVCEAEGALLGFLAIADDYIDRLYVEPTHQRTGIGARLMEVAFAASPARLRLHTHQANTAACAFYERLGFRAVAYGISPPPESSPDVEYLWEPTS